jgi:DNA-binding SARP family transcriptional activator/CheY-like chemotaxis protein
MARSSMRTTPGESRAPVRLRMLGSYEVERSGEPVSLPTRKAAAILAILSIDDERTHTRERIATLLWGDSGPDQSRQSLRQSLFTIRRRFSDVPEPVVADGDRLSIARDVVSSDVEDFEVASRNETVEGLTLATDLYRGEFLDGFHLDENAFETWAQSERERLRQIAIDCHLRLLRLLIEVGRTPDAVQVALRVLAIEPTHEATHRTLMRLYLAQGRRDAAVRQYHICADALFDALRIKPSPETEALFEEIREGAPAPSDASASATARDVSSSVVREMVRPRGRKLVLLIEDAPLNQKVVTSMLESADFDVIVADDGAKALLQMGKHRFDLLLLDLSLPRLSGFDVLEVMKENGDTTPVIVLTGARDAADEVRALDMGASDYLRKPVNKAVLVKRIEKVLS